MAITEQEVSRYHLPLILFDIHRNAKTGTLSVHAMGITKQVYFHKGNAIFASSTSEDDRLGETLVKLGQITNKQYEESVRLLRETGKKQGAILVELGYLTPKDLILGVQYQVREIIYSLFRLKDAEYEFREKEAPSGDVITLQMSMGKLIYEGLRRNNNLSMIRREIPDMQAVLKPRERLPDLLNDIVLSSQEKEMLSLIDGTRTVRELIGHFPTNSFEALKSLFVLHTLGFTEIGNEQAIALTEPQNQQPEETYQSLDLADEPLAYAPVEPSAADSRAIYAEAVSDTDGLKSDEHSDRALAAESALTDELLDAGAGVEQSTTASARMEAPAGREEEDGRKNRRRHKRYKVEGAAVYGEMLFKKEVTVLNMSVSGIALLTDRQLKIGIEYVLNLQDEERIITVKAVVVRSTLSQSKTDSTGNVIPLYFVGMQFTNLSEQKTRDIMNFIENHKTADQQKSLSSEQTDQSENARFQIGEVGKTLINFQEFYKVKVISLTGMLIDSSHFLNINDKLHMRILIHEGRMIDFVGRVASCVEKTDGQLRHYDIGIEFTEMSEEHRSLLQDFCNNIENMQNVNISAVPTETPERSQTQGLHSLNTGDADLFILEGKYADAMAIYQKLLTDDPANIHILKRIDALSARLGRAEAEKAQTDSTSKVPAPELAERMIKRPDRRSSAISSISRNTYEGNDSSSRWYSKFVKRIISNPSANSSR